MTYDGLDPALLAFADGVCRSGAGHLLRYGDSDRVRQRVQQAAHDLIMQAFQHDARLTRETVSHLGCLPATDDRHAVAAALGFSDRERVTLDEDEKPAERTAALATGLMHAAALYARRQLVAVDTIAEDVRPGDDGATVAFTTGLALSRNAEPLVTVTGTARYAAGDDGLTFQDATDLALIRADGERGRLTADTGEPDWIAKYGIPETDRPAAPAGVVARMLAEPDGHDLHAAATAAFQERATPPGPGRSMG